jgi:hypothetical protein
MSPYPSLEGLEQRLKEVTERNSELGKAIGFVGAKANKLAADFAGKLDQVRADLRREIEASVQRAAQGSATQGSAPLASAGAQPAVSPAFVSQVIAASEQVFQRVATLPLHGIPPARVNFYRLQLDRSRENLRVNLGQAALALAQECFSGLTTLEVEIVARQVAWETARQSALQKLTKLTSAMQSQKSVPAHDKDGQALKQMLDVDFWTRGQWQQLFEAAGTKRAFLASPPGDALPEAFERIETEFIPAEETGLGQLVAGARWSAIRAQQRLNIAERVVEFLGARGYQLQGAEHFENNDYRAACFAKLSSPSQGELILAVRAPEFYNSELNSLEIHCFDEAPQHVLVTRRDEIAAGLQGLGLPAILFTGFTNRPQEGIREQFAAGAA